jgi:hypothetical protein
MLMKRLFDINSAKNTHVEEENGFIYRMPFAYYEKLKNHLKAISAIPDNPIEQWYHSLRTIEKRIVERRKKTL